MRWVLVAVASTLALSGVSAGVARAEFPYTTTGSPTDFTQLRVGAGQAPNDLGGDGNDWKFASTPESGNPNNNKAMELFGVRGGHLADAGSDDDLHHTGWQVTTGRPDVAIAVLDSGIKWNDFGNMRDLHNKIRLNRGELPRPVADRAVPTDPDVPACTASSKWDGAGYDINKDGVFNDLDYACDQRVDPAPVHGSGSTYPPNWDTVTNPANGQPGSHWNSKPLLDPEDVIIAFSDGTDADDNGFVDDIAGWDFLDNDNDAFDDVGYGHGTGEALDSSAEANNSVTRPRPNDPSNDESYGDQVGACPNCFVIPLRVGDSFVADVNNFAQAAIYATDNGISVIQEALGTLNKSAIARHAVDYAYNHGVTIIASAADEAAQHHNWPSAYPHVIVVNSVNQYDSVITPPLPAAPGNQSYLQFNGCTNFMSKITVAIPSSSCSSNATGVGAGMAGIVISAARDAGLTHDTDTCRRTDQSNCVISANEVRQLMASGTVKTAGADCATPTEQGFPCDQADDVNFTQDSLKCPDAGCTDPNELDDEAIANRPIVSPLVESQSYPARPGFDEFYGYGRVNMDKAATRAKDELIPPEVEIFSPEWYDNADPKAGSVDVRGFVAADHADPDEYTCQVYVAPGSQPNNATTPDGDFKPLGNEFCDGKTKHSAPFDGILGRVDLNDLKTRFPISDFTGPETDIGLPNLNGRPNPEPYGYTVKVVATAAIGSATVKGEDRRGLFLHRDADMLAGFPMALAGDVESSPLLVDLDGDDRNELVVANSDGIVHAFRRDGSELPGWPVHGDRLPLHLGGRAFTTGEVSDQAYGAMLSSPAAGDIDHDGSPEVVVADMGGKVYAFKGNGDRLWTKEANIDFSGRPVEPFVNSRHGKLNRTQHGFFASPVLVRLDGSTGGPLDVVIPNMDRHLYAFRGADGSAVPGFPMLVADPDKIAKNPDGTYKIDPVTDQITFDPDKGAGPQQGAIIDTPAVGDLDGDKKPEIVLGTNEEYDAGEDGGWNASGFNQASLATLAQIFGLLDRGPTGSPIGIADANSRVYAIKATGGDIRSKTSPFLAGWPFKPGILMSELLPVVGEGVTGYPVIAPVSCASGGAGNKVGTFANAGPAYILNVDATSCQGEDQDGHAIPMQSDFSAGQLKYDTPAVPAVGNPAFGNLGNGTGVTLVAPAAGLVRALDLAANEYQRGQDFVAAWEARTGQFLPGFPSPVNDLQFLTGPSIADIDGQSGQEILEGTASLDLHAFDSTGADLAGWPKLTSDWMVANPLIGSFGTLDTDADARKVVIAGTRRGDILGYKTDSQPCSGADSWPRFHHDNWNTGAYGAAAPDTTGPGALRDVSLTGGTLSFLAGGDDLLCGKAASYQVAQSDEQITGANFDRAAQVDPKTLPAPGSPGDRQQIDLPPATSALARFVAVRAVDDGGNVSPVAVVDRGASATQGDGTGGGGSGTSGVGGSGPSAGLVCAAVSGFRSVSVAGRGRGLAFAFAARTSNPVSVDVFATSVGRRVIGDRLVARFTGRRAGFSWNGRATRGGRVRDGYYYARLRIKGVGGVTDTRRVTLRRTRGRFAVRPAHYARASCGVLETYKLTRPVFGGTRRRSLGIAVRLNEPATVTLDVLRAGKRIRRLASGARVAGRTFRFTLASKGLRSGDYRFRLVATRATETVTSTLTARRL